MQINVYDTPFVTATLIKFFDLLMRRLFEGGTNSGPGGAYLKFLSFSKEKHYFLVKSSLSACLLC